MIVEKRSRFYRLYDLVTTPRKTSGVPLPMVGKESLMTLFQAAIDRGTASVPQKNKDTVELVKIGLDKSGTYLALLFHRASPDAPPPMFRRKAGQNFNLRPSQGEEDEEQAYSSHMLISIADAKNGIYRMALEEVPGLSASAVVGVLKKIASASTYECQDDRGRKLETYTIINCDGYSSESLAKALENGRIDYIDLWKDPDEDLERDGAYAASRQKVTLKTYEPITPENWKSKFSEIFSIADKKGFDDVKVRIDFNDDRRSRTISIDRDKDAAEMLFVRSKLFNFNEDLDLCYIDFSVPILKKAKDYLTEAKR